MIIWFGGVVHGSESAHARLEGAGPAGDGVVIGADIGIFVRSLIRQEGFAACVLGTGMLERGDRVAKPVVGEELNDVIGRDCRQEDPVKHDGLKHRHHRHHRIKKPFRHGILTVYGSIGFGLLVPECGWQTVPCLGDGGGVVRSHYPPAGSRPSIHGQARLWNSAGVSLLPVSPACQPGTCIGAPRCCDNCSHFWAQPGSPPV